MYATGAPLRAIGARLGRSEDAVSERRRSLGLAARPRSRPWTPAEDALLRAAASQGLSAATVARRLGRPADQVRRRRRAYEGPRQVQVRYSAAEDAAIVAAFEAERPVSAVAVQLGRPEGSVRVRAQRLGVHTPARRQRWQPFEDAVVRDGYELGLTCNAIAAQLTGRTGTAVAARAAKLGLATYARGWKARDDRDLERLALDGVPLERAAQRLARTPESLRARARVLGIAPPRPGAGGRAGLRWTDDEDALLRLHAGLSPGTLAELLDRSPEAVVQRLRRLGLRQDAERSPHHPVSARVGLTPGQRNTVQRELRDGGPGRRLLVAARLGVRPGDLPTRLETVGASDPVRTRLTRTPEEVR